MSVLKNLRSLSNMEFYKNAIRIRRDLTDWLLRDFGNKGHPRSVTQVIKNIDPEDQKAIDDIFRKYGRNPNREYQSEYPAWFVNAERDVIIRILQDLVINITKANSIYIQSMHEYDLRRGYQTKAINDCYCIYQELQYIVSVFGTDLNRFIPVLESIEKEIDLLKGWRQSDNKRKPKGNA